MDTILQKISIKSRLYAIILIPSAAMLAIFYFILSDLSSQSDQLKKLSNSIEMAPKISAVIHELQKERGRSAGFLGARDKQDLISPLNAQRALSDQAIDALKQSIQTQREQIDATLYAQIQQSLTSLSEITQYREQVTNTELAVGQMATLYTAKITQLIDILKLQANLSLSPNITRQITAYLAIIEQKEKGGLERAMGANGFSAGQFSPRIYQRFINLTAQQTAYNSVFLAFAPDAILKLYKTQAQGEIWERVNTYRTIVLNSSGQVASSNISANIWFAAITEKLNSLKAIEDQLATVITNTAAKEAKDIAAIFSAMLYTAIFITATSLIIGTIIGNSIDKPIRKLILKIQELSTGKLTTLIPYLSAKSAIGDIARAIDSFRVTLQEKAVADKKAKAKEKQEILLALDKKNADDKKAQKER